MPGDCTIGVSMDFSSGRKNALKWAIDNLVDNGDTLHIIHINPNSLSKSLIQTWGKSGSPLIPLAQFREPEILKKYDVPSGVEVLDMLDTVSRQKEVNFFLKTVLRGDAREKLLDAIEDLKLESLLIMHAWFHGLAVSFLSSAAYSISIPLYVYVISTGMQLLSKVVLNDGTFVLALMTYRHLVAALCMAPFAFFFERDIKSKLSWSVLFWLVVNSLCGIVLALGLLYYGLKDTTATYAANFLNLVPIVTFVFSIISRIEKLGLGGQAGKMKISGAILCVAGALVAGLYKGKAFHIMHQSLEHHAYAKVSKVHWARGSFMLIGSCLSFSAWYILQVKLLKEFPFKYYATMFTCIIASLISAVIGVCLDRSKEAWKIKLNLQLVTIIYTGALSTPATFCLIGWAIVKRGPTYPAMFNPLTLISVAILEALILGAEITVGLLLGMVLIITGLYSFLLGKRKEMKNVPEANIGAATAIDQSPLIQPMASSMSAS